MPNDYRRFIPNDPLDRKYQAGVRQLGLERIQPGGPPSESTPPATYPPLAGLRSNQRGNQVLVDSTQIGQNNTTRNTIVEARSPGDDADLITIATGYQLTRSISVAGSPLFDTAVVGTVQWGIGGAEFSADFDWLNGTIIAIPANYIRVIATVPDNSALVPAPGDIFPSFLLSAALGYGTVPPHANRARLTVGFQTATTQVANAASATIVIPDFAVGFTIMTSTGTGPISIVQSDTTSGGALYRYVNTWLSGSNSLGQDTQTFAVGQGADIVTITNQSGQAQKVYAVFDLAF